MMTKEEYNRETVRMWDSVRTNSKGEHTCSGVQCEDCPLYYVSLCHSYGSINAYDVYEKAIKCIDYVERWSKDHPPKKHKVSQLEYDILESVVKTIGSGFYFFEIDSLLMSLLEKGYFDGATPGTNVKEYFENCEVDCELGGNENVKRRKV